MAEIFAFLQERGINKRILHAGKGGESDYEDGTKVYFHYKTSKLDEAKTVLDDSHNYEKPMELILGKKFKLEVWEVCLKTMKETEVAEFIVDKKHLDQYPMVAKSLRDIFGKNKKSPASSGHCCGMMAAAEQGLGYPDLDDLMRNSQPLAFTIEVTKVERVGSFEKETWTLTDDERRVRVQKLRENGNALFKEKKLTEASEKYAEAIGILEQLVLKEKPGDDAWHELENQKMPLLSNFSQCKLSLGEYYPVIEHTTTVLNREPDNVKALFRRAKAHVGVWNPEEARNDFKRVVELDPKLNAAVTKELKLLEATEKEKDATDKEKFQKMFQSTS